MIGHHKIQTNKQPSIHETNITPIEFKQDDIKNLKAQKGYEKQERRKTLKLKKRDIKERKVVMKVDAAGGVRSTTLSPRDSGGAA
jgi:hypothetical protein